LQSYMSRKWFGTAPSIEIPLRAETSYHSNSCQDFKSPVACSVQSAQLGGPRPDMFTISVTHGAEAEMRG